MRLWYGFDVRKEIGQQADKSDQRKRSDHGQFEAAPPGARGGAFAGGRITLRNRARENEETGIIQGVLRGVAQQQARELAPTAVRAADASLGRILPLAPHGESFLSTFPSVKR